MIVLDCCTMMALAQTSERADLVRAQIEMADAIIAPELLKAELVSAYRKLALSGMCEVQEAAARVVSSIGLIDTYISLDDLCVEALSESVRLNHSSYDMFYLVLARRNAATLVTLDKALGRLCRSEHVISVGWE